MPTSYGRAVEQRERDVLLVAVNRFKGSEMREPLCLNTFCEPTPKKNIYDKLEVAS